MQDGLTLQVVVRFQNEYPYSLQCHLNCLLGILKPAVIGLSALVECEKTTAALPHLPKSGDDVKETRSRERAPWAQATHTRRKYCLYFSHFSLLLLPHTHTPNRHIQFFPHSQLASNSSSTNTTSTAITAITTSISSITMAKATLLFSLSPLSRYTIC